MKLKKIIHPKINKPIYYIEDPQRKTYPIKDKLKNLGFKWYNTDRWWAKKEDPSVLPQINALGIDISDINQSSQKQEPENPQIKEKNEEQIPELTNKTDSDEGKMDSHYNAIPSERYYGFKIKQNIYQTDIIVNVDGKQVPLTIIMDRSYNKGRRKIPSYKYTIKYKNRAIWDKRVKASSEWGTYNEDEMAQNLPNSIQKLVDEKKLLYKSIIEQLNLDKRDPEFTKIIDDWENADYKNRKSFIYDYIKQKQVPILNPEYKGLYDVSLNSLGHSIYVETKVDHPLAPREVTLKSFMIPSTIQNLEQFEQLVDKFLLENQKEIEERYLKYLKSFPYKKEEETKSRGQMSEVIDMIGKNFDTEFFKNKLSELGYIRPSKKVKKEERIPGFVPKDKIKWVLEDKKIRNDAYRYTQNPNEFYSTIAYWILRKARNITSWTDMMLVTAIDHWYKLAKKYGHEIKYENIEKYFDTISSNLYKELFYRDPPKSRTENYEDFYNNFYGNEPKNTSYTSTRALENFVSFVTNLGITQEQAKTNPKSVYRQLSLKLHPDRNPNNPEAEQKFKQLSVLYNQLPTEMIRASNWYQKIIFSQL